MLEQAEEILERFLQIATEMRSRKRALVIPPEIVTGVNPFLKKIETDKSLVSVIVTSAIKKLISPEQDIRLHMAKFPEGYSARILDTKVITPFFNRHFSKYANKESAFLTKATRADVIWDLNKGQSLPLRSRSLIGPFLSLIDKIQHQTINVELCIVHILGELLILSEHHQIDYDAALKASAVSGVTNIGTILEMLTEHFGSNRSSRLPVIAIYAIYEQMMQTIKRYENKTLLPLNVHTSADRHGYGDVEVVNADGSPYEVVEVKHNIPIDQNLVIDVSKKAYETSIQKYYILTTYPNTFESQEDENRIKLLILKIKKDTGMEIIPNGIIQSIKYYLRFVDDYTEYVRAYTRALVNDSQASTEVKPKHISEWTGIQDRKGLF